MIKVDTIEFFWYDGNTPIATLKDGREVVLSAEEAQNVLDWSEALAADASIFTT